MRWQFFKDAKGQWRWRIIADGRIIRTSQLGYASKRHAVENAVRCGWTAEQEVEHVEEQHEQE